MERATGTEVYGCGSPQSSDITLNIQTTTGGNFSISVNGKNTVEHLKKLVSKKLKVAKDRICLLHRERQLRDGTLEDNGLLDGSRVILLPSVETGLLSQRPENSVMQALESLNDTQVNDFLSGKSPLNLTMRLGDHMMLIQLQLSTLNANPNTSASSSTTSRSLKTSTPTKSSSPVRTKSDTKESPSPQTTSQKPTSNETPTNNDKNSVVSNNQDVKPYVLQKQELEMLKNAFNLINRTMGEEKTSDKSDTSEEKDESMDTTNCTLSDLSETSIESEQSPIKSLSNLVSSPMDTSTSEREAALVNSVKNNLIEFLSQQNKIKDDSTPSTSAMSDQTHSSTSTHTPDSSMSDDSDNFTDQSSFLAENTIDEYPMENLFNSAVDKGLFENQDDTIMDREISNLATTSHGSQESSGATLPSFQNLNEPRNKRFQYLLHKTSKFKHPIGQNKQKAFMQSVVNKHKKRMQSRQENATQLLTSQTEPFITNSRRLILQPSDANAEINIDDANNPSVSSPGNNGTTAILNTTNAGSIARSASPVNNGHHVIVVAKPNSGITKTSPVTPNYNPIPASLRCNPNAATKSSPLGVTPMQTTNATPPSPIDVSSSAKTEDATSNGVTPARTVPVTPNSAQVNRIVTTTENNVTTTPGSIAPTNRTITSSNTLTNRVVGTPGNNAQTRMVATPGPSGQTTRIITSPGTNGQITRIVTTPGPGGQITRIVTTPGTSGQITRIISAPGQHTRIVATPGHTTRIIMTPGINSHTTKIFTTPGNFMQTARIGATPGANAQTNRIVATPGPSSQVNRTVATSGTSAHANRTSATPGASPQANKTLATPGTNAHINRTVATPVANAQANRMVATPGTSAQANRPISTPGTSAQANRIVATPGTSAQANRVVATPSSASISSNPQSVSNGNAQEDATPSTSKQAFRAPDAPKKPQRASPTPPVDTKALIEASKNLTQKLKKLSKEVLTNKIITTDESMRTKIGPGAVIESMKHHGKGIYSGTFSGTLNPALQDRYGRPKRDISTIIHILNDLLCATPPIALSPKEPKHACPSATEDGKCGCSQPCSYGQCDGHSAPKHCACAKECSCSRLDPPLCTACAAKPDTQDICKKCDTAKTLALENTKTKGKLEQLRLVMQQKKQRREARKLKTLPYSTPPKALPSPEQPPVIKEEIETLA